MNCEEVLQQVAGKRTVAQEAGAQRGSVSGTFFHAIDGLKT